MKKISKRRLIDLSFIICHLSFSVVIAAFLFSCSMLKDDLSRCPDCRNPLHVTLRYDYNAHRANMFPDHVEEATVFVVDPATNMIVETQTAANSTTTQPLRNPTFAFNIEGLLPGSYRLYAMGRSAADATCQVNKPDIAQNITDLLFSMPADKNGNLPAQRLDTLWNTLQPVDIVIPEDSPTDATIPLMRLTNDLNVLIFRRDTPADNSHERYDVKVVDQYPAIGYDNKPTESRTLIYRPFAAWTTETTVSDGSPTRSDSIAERNAHYDLSLSRLISHDDARQNARLIISNREDGKEIVNIDLCYYLALARNAYEYYHYGTQEYLDREYDYRLDFGIEGNTWKYMNIHINLLSWAIRIQNEEL